MRTSAVAVSRWDLFRASGDKLAAWSLLGVGLPTLLRGPRLAPTRMGIEPEADVLVCVFLRGGLDGLSAVVPLFEDEYYRQRPTLAIPGPHNGDDNVAIELDGRFGLHPALRPLMDAWEAGHLACVHALGSPDPTHSHFDAMDYMERGTPGDKTVSSGWIARHLSTIPGQEGSPFEPAQGKPFRAVGMGGVLPASLRGPVPVATLQSITDFRLQGDVSDLERLQETLAQLYSLDSRLRDEAQNTLDAVDMLAGVDVAGYAPDNQAQYPETEFGRAMKQIAQLVKAEIGVEVACVDMDGFDTHANQGSVAGPLPSLLSDLGQGLAAFYRDLSDWTRNVVVVTMSEFGRRVYENGSAGTDHGHGGVMFALGGGVNGGKVYGDWPGLSQADLYGPGDLAVTTDFRDVLGELVEKRLGNAAYLPTIFPDHLVNPRGIFSSRDQ